MRPLNIMSDRVFYSLLARYGLWDHPLVLTDKRDALVAAINEGFPDANRMLRQWHLHKLFLCTFCNPPGSWLQGSMITLR